MSEESRAAEKALFFTIGAFLGATIALLLAPRSGEETRKLIVTKAREGADYVTSRSRDVVEKTSTYLDRGKEAIQHQKEQLAAALDAGKQAYREEKEKAKS